MAGPLAAEELKPNESAPNQEIDAGQGKARADNYRWVGFIAKFPACPCLFWSLRSREKAVRAENYALVGGA
jgi:hypothetical protein